MCWCISATNKQQYDMETNEKMTYSAALAELEEILKALEQSEEANLDLISSRVKRASELMEICRKQLHELDEELQKIVEGI